MNLEIYKIKGQSGLLKAENEKLKAIIAYLSMMTDVEIPLDEEEGGSDE